MIIFLNKEYYTDTGVKKLDTILVNTSTILYVEKFHNNEIVKSKINFLNKEYIHVIETLGEIEALIKGEVK